MTNKESRSNRSLEQEETDRLKTGTNQTIACNEFETGRKQVFSAAELWDIQKRKKEIRPRRNTIWS